MSLHNYPSTCCIKCESWYIPIVSVVDDRHNKLCPNCLEKYLETNSHPLYFQFIQLNETLESILNHLRNEPRTANHLK